MGEPIDDGIGAAGDGLRDVAAGPHATVGDHMAVPAGLVQVLAAGGGGVGDRRRLRHADPQHPPCGAGVPGPHADEDADGSRPHQVQCSLVAGATAHDHGEVEPRDEPLEVERLDLGADVLGRDHRALDHEDVESGLQDERGEPLDALRRQRRARDDAAFLDLADPSPMSSSLIGSRYSSCIRRVAFSSASEAISS